MANKCSITPGQKTILLSLLSAGSDCYSIEYRRCFVQFNSEYRFDILRCCVYRAQSHCIFWLESLQLLVVNARQQEEEFGLLGCMSGTGGGMDVNLSHFYIHRFIRAIWTCN